jgi:(S)-mandelate dehydrogenase
VIALALRARGVFIGRPYLYALAAGGEDGVRRALELLEMRNAMTLLGTPDLGSVTRSEVV